VNARIHEMMGRIDPEALQTSMCQTVQVSVLRLTPPPGSGMLHY
jgi:hypothetical protein